MSIYANIIGTGSYLPERRVDNFELAKELETRGLETSDEWIFTRSGIKARHFAHPNETTSDLAVHAARAAIHMAGIEPDSIDLIVLATSTPDHLGGFPSTACVVQHKLGIKTQSAAFDVQAVCSGFIYGLHLADALIRGGAHQRVLVIGAETFSRILDFNDRSTCVLFGDGAGAVLLQAGSEPGILSTAVHADGGYRDILCIPGAMKDGAIAGSGFLTMDGQAVFKLAVKVLEQVGREVLEKAHLSTSQIDWLIPHQANIRIMEGTAKKLGIANDHVIVTLSEQGNTSAASIPLALDEGVRSGKIIKGQHLLLEGVGGGFTWGAACIRF
jgi:3-oxoacyl-[acyl-carrier-protein] synthase-3